MLMTYERYQELGGTLEEQHFNAYIRLTEADFQQISGGVLPDAETLEICCMMMLTAYDKSANLPVMSRATSFSNDGVSMSLALTETAQSIKRDALRDVRKLFAAAGVRTYARGVLLRE